MSHQQTVGIVGAGLVGSGWAVVFARAGYSVRVYDPSEAVRSRVLGWAAESLKDLALTGLVDDAESALSRISIHDTLEAAVKGTFYVQSSCSRPLRPRPR